VGGVSLMRPMDACLVEWIERIRSGSLGETRRSLADASGRACDPSLKHRAAMADRFAPQTPVAEIADQIEAALVNNAAE
ncbi:MAG: hypothetical protein AAFP69_15410, partial [Planctomycetota bacterium]